MGQNGRKQRRRFQEAKLSIWTESLFIAELLLLHASPVYYGLGVEPGNGAAVVLIPGFLCPDVYLVPLGSWLERIGYRAFYSGVGINSECPNLLIQNQLNKTIDKALQETEQKVHLLGHSLGGIIARSLAVQRPKEIASVITLGAPVSGLVAHSAILRAVEHVRLRIAKEHGDAVLPECYTSHCGCDFLNSAHRRIPRKVLHSSVYTRDDGILDWRCCMTGDCDADFVVTGTHIGLAFNPLVYSIVAKRLADAERICSTHRSLI